MSTMTLPAAPAPAPEPRFTTSGSVRFVAVHANLLPDEIIEARRGRQIKRYVIIGLGGLLALVVALYGLSVWQTSRAKDNLQQAQERTIALQHQKRQYQPLLEAQAESEAVRSALIKLMAGDLQWKDMLTTLRSTAKGGVEVTGVTGTLSAGATKLDKQSAGLDVLNNTGNSQVGTLTITGTARDKNAVAEYVDELSKVAGLTAPFPASVTTANGTLTFSVSAIITSEALGGRYAPAGSSTGGK